MNYKLKRDLPFAEAGVKIYDMNGDPIDDLTGCRVHSELEGGAPIYIGNKEKLLAQGWIEPIKPREWVINIGDDGAAIFKDGKMLFKFGRVDTPVIEKIKVREVIE